MQVKQKESNYKLILKEIPNMPVMLDEPMSSHTSFKVGGPADILAAPAGMGQLKAVIALLRRENIPYTIIGNGTNLIVRDGGIRGVVVKIQDGVSGVAFEEAEVTAEAGTLLSALVRACIDNGLAGLEFAGGIPGTVGGAVSMNAGAYENEIKSFIKHVRVLDNDGTEKLLGNKEMAFGYRTSIVAKQNLVVLSATFQLGFDSGNSRMLLNGYNTRRREKQPLNYPSAGSVFKRPPGKFAGALIEQAGLKGHAVGGAKVSELHAGFIINTGGACALDILRLIEIIQSEVYGKFEIMLEPEIKVIGEALSIG